MVQSLDGSKAGWFRASPVRSLDGSKPGLNQAGKAPYPKIEPGNASGRNRSHQQATGQAGQSERNARNLLGLPALDASIGGVQDFLILPTLFSGGGKLGLALDSVGERVDHVGIGQLIGNGLGFYNLAAATKLKLDGMLDVESIIGVENTALANEFQRRAIVGAIGGEHRSQGAAGKLQGKRRGRFQFARNPVPHAEGADPQDLILQDEAKRIDAMNAHVGDGAATGYFRIIEPLAGVTWTSGEGEQVAL